MNRIFSFFKRLIDQQPVRYFASSCAAFAVDYTLLLVLNAIFSSFTGLSMEAAQTLAFAVSSQLNFWLNRKWVFRSRKSVLPELGGYYSLAFVSFAIKTFALLEIFVRIVHIPLSIAKLIAEAVMFVFNFFVQKMFIFRHKGS